MNGQITSIQIGTHTRLQLQRMQAEISVREGRKVYYDEVLQRLIAAYSQRRADESTAPFGGESGPHRPAASARGLGETGTAAGKVAEATACTDAVAT